MVLQLLRGLSHAVLANARPEALSLQQQLGWRGLNTLEEAGLRGGQALQQMMQVAARTITSSSGVSAEAAVALRASDLAPDLSRSAPTTQQPRWLRELGVIRNDWT